jgi:preprotein translocase subunit SecF
MKLLKLVPEGTNLDFMRWRNLALVLSLIATVSSIGYTAYKGLNLGVDFIGGQLIRVSFPQPIDDEQLRSKVDSMHLGEAGVTRFGGPKSFQIRLPKPPGGDAAANSVATQVKQEIEKDYPGAKIESVDTVSGKVSEELASSSATAIALAMLGIALYIWFRFEWQFGVGALLTLAHDVAMTLGFFAFSRLPVDLNVVAAFLTIVGYSLNDTVVIYDRIREMLRRYKKMPMPQLLNESINSTLSRSIITHVTVTLALLALLLFGGNAIHSFTAVMMFGVVLVGTYTSIFIAAPILIYLGVGDHRADAPEKPTKK